MPRGFDGDRTLVLPRPSKALTAVLVGLLALWVIFAVGINWGGASLATFEMLVGNTQAIAEGQIWRLLTAPLMHHPVGSEGVQHIAFALMGLYFLAPALEGSWGTKRLLTFLAIAGPFAYAVQWTVELALPLAWSARLVPPLWYGSTPVLEALVIAFALSLRDQRVLLFFVLPVGSKALIYATVGISVLLLIADALGPSGHIAPFAGMFAGWLFGAGTPSPARRLWLRLRLSWLDAEARRGPKARIGRKAHRFEVIAGGRDRDPKRRGNGKGNGRMLH